ncbi:hypothetical protein CR513_14605, partial [Mucuna pruriens]
MILLSSLFASSTSFFYSRICYLSFLPLALRFVLLDDMIVLAEFDSGAIQKKGVLATAISDGTINVAISDDISDGICI